MQEYITDSEKETLKIGRKLGKKLKNKNIVLIEGDLGAGKTVLARGIVSKFSHARVSSPSFAIVNTYSGKNFDIHHLDLYRIKNEDEIYALGGGELIYGDGLKIIEWPQRLKGLKNYTVKVCIEKIDENKRRILVNWII